MDHASLKTASTYINNLLLARGLLRDGVPIEFARPGKGGSSATASASERTDATMARVINLVHDLILRRDKDQSHASSLSTTLQHLRSTQTTLTTSLTRLETSLADTQRQLSLSQSQERSLRSALRAAEGQSRAAREELARTKQTAAQIRANCQNDVRKRDVQIQRLKSHLTSKQRGDRGGVVGTSITINPGAGVVGGGVAGAGAGRRPDEMDDGRGLVDDPAYSLKQETTEFLTQLSQQLSDENDNLIGLVRSSISTLRELQGLPEETSRRTDADIPGNFSHGSSGPTAADDGGAMAITQSLSTSYESLATDMDGLLDNLRNLLTNPNFVSIDEVESREEEIGRLRAGWEKMETRWRGAIDMMEGWRRRVGADDNEVSIKIDELKAGLGLGLGLSVMGGKGAPPFAFTGGLMGHDELDDSDASGQDDTSDDELHLPSSEDEAESPAEDPIFDIKLVPQKPQALQEGHGNSKSPRKVSFVPASQAKVEAAEHENASEVDLLPTSTTAAATNRSDRRKSRIPEPPAQRTRKTLKRHSSPRRHPDEPAAKMTVQQKLDVAQAEAEAAAIAARLDAATATAAGTSYSDKSRSINKKKGEKDGPAPAAASAANASSSSSPKEQAGAFQQNGAVAATKRRRTMTKITGRARRRKSTLSPEELDALLGLDQ